MLGQRLRLRDRDLLERERERERVLEFDDVFAVCFGHNVNSRVWDRGEKRGEALAPLLHPHYTHC